MKVIFTRDIIQPACGDHPDLLIVEKGEVGYLTEKQGSWPAYVFARTTSTKGVNGELIGCNLDEFRPVLEFVI